MCRHLVENHSVLNSCQTDFPLQINIPTKKADEGGKSSFLLRAVTTLSTRGETSDGHLVREKNVFSATILSRIRPVSRNSENCR